MFRKRFLPLLLCLVFCLCLVLTAQAAEGETITIFYTNDVHTYIDGDLRYSTVAGLKSSWDNALLVDAGDHIQGTAYGSMDSGRTIIDLMNAAGYDLATLGNHEFDYGMSGCMNAISWAQFPYVSCNFYHEEGGVVGETVLESYQLFEVGGQTVAFIGITTPESFTKSTPAYFQNDDGEYIFGIAGGADGSALYAAVQAAIDEASQEADIVIALGHLGDDPSSQPWTSEELIANTTGLDAFIDGHSHSTVEQAMVTDRGGDQVVLTQTGSYLAAVGQMTISPDGTITTRLLTADELTDIQPDPQVAAIEEQWTGDIDSRLGQVIGSMDDTLDNYDTEGNRLVRSQETNTGDFAADALYYLFDSMDMDVDIAVMNGGGIRNQAITGDLTYLTCKEIHTFGNVACLQSVTGQQILDALEWGARDAGSAECGGFLQVSGLKYTIDTTIEQTIQKDEKGVWTGGPTGEYRVRDVQVLSRETGEYEPLDLTATYNLAGYNYTLRDLGDGYAMFDGAVNVLDYVMTDYMVLANYIQSFENGKVTGYAEPQGRISIIYAEDDRSETGAITMGGLDNDLWTTKYGNIYCDCKAETFLGSMGFQLGDLVTVSFNGQQLTMPVVPAYSYVDSGEPAIIAGLTDSGVPTGYISLAINMGNFAETYGIAIKHTDDEGNWWWTAAEGVSFPMELTFELAQSRGYQEEYILHQLQRTNERQDYAHLTDEEFANFRPVPSTDLLYRSSSPIDPELGRSAYAAAAMEAAGIKTILNLADSADEAAAYPDFEGSYYSGQNVIYLSLGVDTQAVDFQSGLANGLRFMAANEGPYLVHCSEGKDRAGFVSALLECFMGADVYQVIYDYMATYINYYGVEPGADNYYVISESNIVKFLQQSFDVTDLFSADLKAEATEYMQAIGLTDSEIAQLAKNLSGQPDELVYTVSPGDCLWSIAQTQLGDGALWVAIYQANQSAIKDPGLILVGQQLVIPAR